MVTKDQWLVIQASQKAGAKIHKINNLLAIYSIAHRCLEFQPNDQEILDIFETIEVTLRIFVSTGNIINYETLKNRAEILHVRVRPQT